MFVARKSGQREKVDTWSCSFSRNPCMHSDAKLSKALSTSNKLGQNWLNSRSPIGGGLADRVATATAQYGYVPPSKLLKGLFVLILPRELHVVKPLVCIIVISRACDFLRAFCSIIQPTNFHRSGAQKIGVYHEVRTFVGDKSCQRFELKCEGEKKVSCENLKKTTFCA